MARAVFFLTSNLDKFDEIADLMEDEIGLTIEHRTARLPVPPSNEPAEVARFRALQAFPILGGPVFAEAIAIELADGALSGASFRQAFEDPRSGWLAKHHGHKGVARVCVGYTADGKTAQLFESSVPGMLVKTPRGEGNAAWESHWIPEGRRETLAELADEADGDALRNGAYLALAKALALP